MGRAGRIAPIWLHQDLHKHSHTVIFQPGMCRCSLQKDGQDRHRSVGSREVPAEIVCWMLRYLWRDPLVSRSPQRGGFRQEEKLCLTKSAAQLLSQPSVIHRWFNTNSLGKINALRFEDGYLIHKSYRSCLCRAAEDIFNGKVPSQPPLLSLKGLGGLLPTRVQRIQHQEGPSFITDP